MNNKSNPLQNLLSGKKLFFILVLIPTFLSVIYYSFFCTERFVSSSVITIRSQSSSQSDLLQSLTGLPSSSGGDSIISDSYAIEQLLISNSMINKLPEELSIDVLFGKEDIDYLSRLNSQMDEDKLNYWENRISINIEPMSNLATLEVQAYTAEEAHKLNEFLIQESENFVNTLSERLKQDATSLSIEELELAKERLLTANNNLASFLDRTGKITFEQSIAAQSSLVSNLEAQLADKKTELSAKTAYLKPSSDSLITLKGEISALERQINQQKTFLSQGESSKTTEEYAQYNKFILEKQFAEQAYSAAQSSLEKNRIEANTQQRYLVRIIEPNVPDEATEPGWLMPILMVFLIAFFSWAILALLIETVKEHIGWVY